MSQEQPIKYRDLFPQVQGELAEEAVAPRDAALMQSAESVATGKTMRGGPAAVMQSAAAKNVRAGLVEKDAIGGAVADQGVTVVDTDTPGRHAVAEYVANQRVGGYEEPVPLVSGRPAETLGAEKLTVGEALEAAALTQGDKKVDRCDAAAIQAAEMRATGLGETLKGGVAAKAQAAASANEAVENITLGDVLSDASSKLPSDKAATREDAERVAAAEMRNNPAMATRRAGVAESVAAAARLNENPQL